MTGPSAATAVTSTCRVRFNPNIRNGRPRSTSTCKASGSAYTVSSAAAVGPGPVRESIAPELIVREWTAAR
ncbi:hypothetical protein [Cellulomonas sp. NPDC089187]|uniref:hypothetical protein n=1 Tax=Cellulomonas sp. NPDC089187 TaxID=3154970 RepID=UPI0034392AF3